MGLSRRELLSGLTALGAGAGLIGRGGVARAAPGDYRALVCVFLFGGNDGNNLIVPVDGRYTDYATARGSGTGGLALPLEQLLPLAPGSGSAAYGLHPAMPEMQALWGAGALAVLFNVGTLVAPATKADDAAGRVPRPLSLLSHQDQQHQWQTSLPDRQSQSGWGGRIADGIEVGAGLPALVSLSGNQLFAAGESTQPLAVPAAGGPPFGFAGTDSSLASRGIRGAFDLIRTLDLDNFLVQSVAGETVAAIAASGVLAPVLAGTGSTIDPFFAAFDSPLSAQLQQVARIIEARNVLGASGQIFFVSLGGFDTHNDQLTRQQRLLTDVSGALKAFYDATVQLGVAGQVTTFTLSDFARTLKPASGGGSDHAWGNHHLILGGAVLGRQTYGVFPTLALNGPDDIGDRGRWLPTTSTDQYAATLARWFGVSDPDLSRVLPNLGRFDSPNLGFLGS